MSETIGPNIRALISRRLAILAIPPGTKDPLFAGVTAIATPGALGTLAREATDWVRQVIAAVRAAPDCTWTTDEEIAGEILRRVKLKEQS